MDFATIGYLGLFAVLFALLVVLLVIGACVYHWCGCYCCLFFCCKENPTSMSPAGHVYYRRARATDSAETML